MGISFAQLGYKQGHVSREILELYDVVATCLDLAGLKAQHTHFARSLVPHLRGEPGDPKRAAYCEGGYNTYEPQDSLLENAARVPLIMAGAGLPRGKRIDTPVMHVDMS